MNQHSFIRLLLVSATVGAAACASTSAFAIDATVLGGLNMASPSIDPSLTGSTTSAKSEFMYGATVGLPFFPGLGLELGAFMAPRTSTTKDVLGNGNQTSAKFIEIPLMLRLNALPFISVGAGMYYGIGTGNVSTKSVSGSTVSSTPTEKNFSDSGLVSSDLGIATSVRAEFSILPLMSIVGDVRYNIGLKDLDQSPLTTTKNRELQLLLGVSAGF